MLAVAIFAVLTLSQGLQAAADSLRGVDPAFADRYDSKRGQFSCFDNSRSIAHSWINDNYCDCTDGSDEPGTSACPNGRFYCRNRGHEPKLVNSSAVEDGICDCCDGTDEAAGRCMNTCLEAGASARAELKARAAAYATGAKVREGYIKRAAKQKADWQAQLKRVATQTSEQQKKVDQAKGTTHGQRKGGLPNNHPATAARTSRRIRSGSRLHRPASAAEKDRVDAEEKAEREERDRVQKELEAAKQLEASKLQVAAGEDSTTLAGKDAPEKPTEVLEPNGQGAVQPPAGAPAEDGGTAQEVARDQEGTESEQVQDKELSSEEEARQRLAQWVHDPEAVTPKESETPKTPAPTEETDDLEEVEEAEEGLIEPNQPSPGLWNRAKLWVLQRLGSAGALTPEAAKDTSRQSIKDNFSTHQGKLTDLTREQAELEKKLKLDLGHEGEYLPLVDQCFDAHVDKYVYSMCAFKEAHQKDGGAHTRLGSWAGWEAGGTVMSFTNGQGCWQGPNRSFRVSVSCGQDESLKDVQEPNRCEYIAKFTTPAACKASDVAAVQKQLASAERDVLDHTEL